jgi:hypothetical protein
MSKNSPVWGSEPSNLRVDERMTDGIEDQGIEPIDSSRDNGIPDARLLLQENPIFIPMISRQTQAF